MLATKYFEIVGEVIESEISGIFTETKRDRELIIQEIVHYANKFHDQYYDPVKPTNEFNEPCCRIAYLFKYVVTNARAIEYIFYNSQELKDYIREIQERKNSIEICALGGGPGTELLGLSKWAEREFKRNGDFSVKCDFVNFDKVKEWGTSWRFMKRNIRDRFSEEYGRNDICWPFRCEGDFYPLDVDETQNYSSLINYFGQDLYIISYFISEIFEISNNFMHFFKKLSLHAPNGAKFVFIERGERKWESTIKYLAETSEITISEPILITDGRIPIRNDVREDAINLGPIFKEIKCYDQSPCTTWNAMFFIGTKKTDLSFI